MSESELSLRMVLKQGIGPCLSSLVTSTMIRYN